MILKYYYHQVLLPQQVLVVRYDSRLFKDTSLKNMALPASGESLIEVSSVPPVLPTKIACYCTSQFCMTIMRKLQNYLEKLVIMQIKYLHFCGVANMRMCSDKSKSRDNFRNSADNSHVVKFLLT